MEKTKVINLDNPSSEDIEVLGDYFRERLRWERIKIAAWRWAANRAEYPESCDLESGY